MRVALVISHPNPASLSHALSRAFEEGAAAAGHMCETIDLAAEGFDPRWSMADVAFDQGGAVPQDVRVEQVRLERADALCFVFPLYWCGMPALLKGWIDRVFSHGWAYDQIGEDAEPLVPRRPCTLLVPASVNPAAWEGDGFGDAMERLWIKGTLSHFGFGDATLHILGGADGSEARRAAHLQTAFEAGRLVGVPGLDDAASER